MITPKTNDHSMTFIEHLEELRRIILRSLVVIGIGVGICLIFSPQLFKILQIPLEKVLPSDSFFIATNPFETYGIYFKISLVFGFFLSTPFIFYLIWSFIHPGLTPQERKGVLPIALICAFLFVGGALFGYFVVFPPGFQFAVSILDKTDILLFPNISDYLTLVIRLLLAFGLIFELPLLLFILGKVGLVSASLLKKYRKYVVVLIFLVAGVLTPGPDILSQVLMATPLLILYEAGIILVKLFGTNENALPQTPQKK